MYKRKRAGSHSKRYNRQFPAIARAILGIAAGVALLVGLAYLYGSPSSKNSNIGVSLHETLQQPLVAAIVASAVFVFIAWCVRQLIFEFNAWWPGGIVVQQFVGEGGDAHLIGLTEAFRDRLARSHLQSTAPVPAPAQQGDFVDVLSNTNMDSKNPLSMVAGFLRVARPTHAYEIKGAVSTRPGDSRPCGVTIHLERLPGKAGPGETLWDTDWDTAIARAANHATASIMPRTRGCKPPWADWRGYRLPPDLLHLYERGVELQGERRFDEALHLYYQAADRDPMNLALRLQIGYLQEKLALFIDALDTYQGILAIAAPGQNGLGWETPTRPRVRPGDVAVTRRTRGDRLRRFYRGPERRNRARVRMVARYRRAILLGGSTLPRQWCTKPQDRKTQRDKEREILRERLIPSLDETFAQALGSVEVEWATRPVYGTRRGRRRRHTQGKLRKPYHARAWDGLTGQHRTVHRLKEESEPYQLLEEADEPQDLEELFVLASIHELVLLRPEIPWLRVTRETPLTRNVVDLSGLCLTQRLKRVRQNLDNERPQPDPNDLARSIRKIERPRKFRRWQEHYNAACAYAIPLLPPTTATLIDISVDETTRNRLIDGAVSHLEHATECADSGFVRNRRDWLLGDDPDLDALRTTGQFKRFEATYFPSGVAVRKRPRDLHLWELSDYTLKLLSGTADQFAACWHARRADLKPDSEIRGFTHWCETEIEAWIRVTEVIRNHRHWRTRVKLVEFERELGMTSDFAPPAPRFPRFAELDDRMIGGIRAWVDHNDERLKKLADELQGDETNEEGTVLLAKFRKGRADLERADGYGATVGRMLAGKLCAHHADLWRKFSSCVTESGKHPDEMTAALEKLVQTWGEVCAAARPSHGRRRFRLPRG